MVMMALAKGARGRAKDTDLWVYCGFTIKVKKMERTGCRGRGLNPSSGRGAETRTHEKPRGMQPR